MQASGLVVSHDVRDFFRHELVSASACLRIALDADVEHYLVNLLRDFCTRDPGQERQLEAPLAVLLARADDAAPAERLALLRATGDLALYRAGFFAEAIEKSLVDVDYYVAMGTRAYHGVARLALGKRRNELCERYEQLAGQFACLVDLLNCVAATSQGRSGRDTDLLKLYERYARTGNERTRQILQARGLSVAPLGTDAPLH